MKTKLSKEVKYLLIKEIVKNKIIKPSEMSEIIANIKAIIRMKETKK
jgi:hypothetical protein